MERAHPHRRRLVHHNSNGSGNNSQTSPTTTTRQHQHSSFGLNSIVETIVNAAEILDSKLAAMPAFSQIAETFNLRPIHLMLAALTFILLLFGILEDFILGFVGYAYPAWASFTAIESGDAGAGRQWIAYWMIYGFLSFMEIFSHYLLFWIPFYYVVKLFFICWLLLPQFNGATKVYSSLIRPLMLARKEVFDEIFNQIGRIKIPTAAPNVTR